MSETPRVDKYVKEGKGYCGGRLVHRDLADELERELAAYRTELEQANLALKAKDIGLTIQYEKRREAESRLASRESEEGLAERIATDLADMDEEEHRSPWYFTKEEMEQIVAALRSRSGRT